MTKFETVQCDMCQKVRTQAIEIWYKICFDNKPDDVSAHICSDCKSFFAKTLRLLGIPFVTRRPREELWEISISALGPVLDKDGCCQISNPYHVAKGETDGVDQR